MGMLNDLDDGEDEWHLCFDVFNQEGQSEKCCRGKNRANQIISLPPLLSSKNYSKHTFVCV